MNCPEGFAHGLNGIRVLDVVRHRARRDDEGDEREDEAHEQAVEQADQPADLFVPLLELLLLEPLAELDGQSVADQGDDTEAHHEDHQSLEGGLPVVGRHDGLGQRRTHGEPQDQRGDPGQLHGEAFMEAGADPDHGTGEHEQVEHDHSLLLTDRNLLFKATFKAVFTALSQTKYRKNLRNISGSPGR